MEATDVSEMSGVNALDNQSNQRDCRRKILMKVKHDTQQQ